MSNTNVAATGADPTGVVCQPARRGPRLALLALAGTALAALGSPTAASAQSVVLSGDYMRFGVNNRGTLGTGGTVRPGILYDGTGTGTFNPNYDYLTPGTPQEAFVVRGSTSGGAFTATNSNASLGSASISGALTSYNGVAYNGSTYDQRVVWTGTYGTTLSVTHDYHFDTDGEQLLIETRITALTDLTGLQFVRLTDPDAVAAPGDTSATNNFQGSGNIPGTDLIYAEATVSHYVIGLYSNDPTPHVTGAPGFTANPAGYLAGTFLGNGDYTIGMGFTIGGLTNGSSISLNYRYIFGTDIAAAVAASSGPPSTPPANIAAGGHYKLTDLTSGGVNPIFDGGVLTVGSSDSVAMDLTVTAAGGGVDTAGHDLSLSGSITGDGGFSKLGDGVLTLSGDNSFKGLTVSGGVLAFGSDTALGAAEGAVTIADGASLRALSDLTIAHDIKITGDNASFDTGANHVVLTGSVTGDGCFVKAGGGLLNLMGAGSNAIGACVQEGTLSFNNVFAGPVYVDPGATAGGGGLIQGAVTVQGALSPGNSPGRLVVAGSVTQAPGSSLDLDIDGPTPGVGAGHYDTLVLAGAGSIYTAGGSIAPITCGVTGAANNTYTPQIGDIFQVVTAEGGVTGAFTQVIQPTAGLAPNTRFDVAYTPNAVILAVTPDRYAALAGSRNAQAVGGAADSLRTSANNFTASLIGLNEGQLAGVLQSATGEIHADGLDAVLQGNRAVRAQISERIEPKAVHNRGVWAAITADTRKVGADATAGSYKVDRTGVVIGLDRRLTPSLLVGVAASYDENEIDAGLMGSARAFTYRGLAYAGWRSGGYYVNGVAGAESGVLKTVRSVDMATGRTRAYAKLHGDGFGGDIEAGRTFSVGRTTMTLAAGLGKDRLTRDGGIEAGDAVTALRFEDATRNALQGRVGGRVQTRTSLGDVQITPYAAAFVLREFDGDSSRLTAGLQGAAFQVAAASPGKTSARLAMGVEAAVTEKARVSFAYRYEGARETDGHAVSLTGAIAW